MLQAFGCICLILLGRGPGVSGQVQTYKEGISVSLFRALPNPQTMGFEFSIDMLYRIRSSEHMQCCHRDHV